MKFSETLFWTLIVCVAANCLLCPSGWAQSGTISDMELDTSGAGVFEMELGDIKNVHRSDNLIFSGQFTGTDLEAIKLNGVQRVITLRNPEETAFDEEALVTDAELDFSSVPYKSEESLTDDVFHKVRNLLRDDSQKTLLHCGSANRVGGVWLTYRVLDQGVDVMTALKEAKKIGLKTPFIEAKALDYIKRQQDAIKQGGEKPKGNADVKFVKASSTGDGKWSFEVTVDHPDVGWRNFANGWDVVLPDGKPILLSAQDKFTRVLAHPHVDERPFTRIQKDIPIPKDTEWVTVRAHDLIGGYGGKEVKVMLDKNKGEGFEVTR